jgi:hypothetical protein
VISEVAGAVSNSADGQTEKSNIFTNSELCSKQPLGMNECNLLGVKTLSSKISRDRPFNYDSKFYLSLVA